MMAPIDTNPDGSIQNDAGVPGPDDAAPPAPDAAVDAGSAGNDAGDPRPLVRTEQVAAIPSDTTKLLGDSTAVFGLTADGTIWSLEQGATSVRQLVAGGNSGRDMAMAIAGTNLFWTSATAGTLHRMARDGSGDVVLATGLASPGQLTADTSRVYWLTAGDSLYGEGGGTIQSLPLDAVPSDTPQVLATIGPLTAVSSMAASGGQLYWTPFSAAATMYYASLVTAPVDALLAGGAGTAIPGISRPYGLAAVGDDIYWGYGRTAWTTAITRLSDRTDLAVLPINVNLSGLSVAGDWLLVSGTGQNRRQELYATPLDSPSGFVVVAADLQCPAVITPWGVTYVNTIGELVAFPTQQLGYVGFGLPPP
jgi:hypothetical protein